MARAAGMDDTLSILRGSDGRNEHFEAWHGRCVVASSVLGRKTICFGLALCAALLAAPYAWAQSVRPALPVRSDDGCGADAGPAEFDPCGGINYAACVNDVTLDFALTVDDPAMSSDHLVVLAGPPGGVCLPAPSSKATPSGCWPVVKGSPALAPTMNVTVRARDITAYLGSATLPTTYTAQTDPMTACQAQTCPGVVDIAIYFLIEGSDDEVPAAEYDQPNGPGEITFHVGTLGPQAPVVATAIINDGFVTLSWQPPTETSIYGYYVYCDNYGRLDAALPGDAPAPAAPDACEETSSGCVNTVDAGSLSGLCPSGPFTTIYTAPACSGTSTTTDTTAEAAAPVAEASTVIDEAGGVATGPIDTSAGISQIPASYLCASPTDTVDGAMTAGVNTTGATISTKNYDFFVFAVAAVDNLGNVGAIGNLQCGTPGPIADFFWNYTHDGGLAGGGFCALEGVGMPAGSACMAVGMGLVGVGFVRRRRRRLLA
jgi:hypothetical protein